MKIFFALAIAYAGLLCVSCKTTKTTINKVIAPRDTVISVKSDDFTRDSLLLAENTRKNMEANYIGFKTFSAKIKVDVESSKGKQPDITATLRMIKDSAIWVSLNASFLNIEVYRIYITPDSVILMNKQDKQVQYRTLDYLQEVTQIPFDFKTLQDILIGNPIFFEESNASFRKLNDFTLVSTVGNDFKNLITLAANNSVLLHSKLDDVNGNRNRTASVTYDDYVNAGNNSFSTRRQIIMSEKNKIDIRLNFKQFEFNKELSVSFSVPKNYKRN